MCKIIDVDFKNKKLNFTYQMALTDKKIKEMSLVLAAVVVDIEAITKDPVYVDWCKGLFINILKNLKDR